MRSLQPLSITLAGMNCGRKLCSCNRPSSARGGLRSVVRRIRGQSVSCLHQAGLLSNAYDVLQMALRANPSSVQVIEALSSVLVMLDRYQDANQILSVVAKQYPGDMPLQIRFCVCWCWHTTRQRSHFASGSSKQIHTIGRCFI